MAKFPIEFTELSNKELVDSVEYYEGVRKGLSERFEKEIEELLQKITTNPFLFPTRFKKYREVPLKKFPYILIYEIVEAKIIIVSVFHAKRAPESKLKKKLK